MCIGSRCLKSGASTVISTARMIWRSLTVVCALYACRGGVPCVRITRESGSEVLIVPLGQLGRPVGGRRAPETPAGLIRAVAR